MSESNDFGAFLMGFTVGALTGAVVSLLLAPQTGDETRQLIKQKTIELKEKGTDTFEETKKKAETAYKEALQKATEAGSATLEKAESVAKKAQTVVDQSISKVAETVKPKKTEV